MKKHAFLIEAHDNKSQLEKLFRCLDYRDNDVFLHVDAKSSKLIGIEQYEFKRAGFCVIPSIPVYWGGYSQIVAEMNLLEAALKKGNFVRYHLISGVDLPLVSQEKMHQFFDDHPDTEFVHFDYVYGYELFRKRMGLFHLLRDHINRSQKILVMIESIFLEIQKIFGVNRIKSFDMEYGKGANWFSITDDFVRYVINQKEWIEKTFKHTKCCDEVFLQTIILNSPFKDKRYYDEREKRYGNLRAVDWNRGNPYIYRKQDYEQLISSHYMFGRKFDCRVDGDIVDMIVDYVTRDI